MRYEGGFQGRTNKLVDGCYSFWQAGAIPIVQALIQQNGMSCFRRYSVKLKKKISFHLQNRH